MAGRDANDVLREEGIEGVRAMMAGATLYTPTTSSGIKYQLIDYQDVPDVIVGQWRIKRLLPATGLMVVYGAPSCGKSFLILHAVLHIASGQAYAGFAVRQCRVIYIAAEGQGNFGNRVRAAGKALKLPPIIPFQLLLVTPDLGRADGDVAQLVKEIKAQLIRQKGPGIIVIDTLSRTMCGANEDAAGIGSFIANAEKIAKELDCLVIAVHHTGKDEARGMRGWSGLHGATDAEWEVTAEDGKHSVTIPKMKDGPDGWRWDFDLSEVEIGRDEDGDPVTTCIVDLLSEPTRQAAVATTRKPQKRSKAYKAFDDALDDALIDHGEVYYVGDDRTASVKAVRISQVKPYFSTRYPTAQTDKRLRDKAIWEAFSSFVKKLPDEYGHEARGDVERVWRLS